ncbi:hypothetical protein FRC08_015983, partial [Ceratobasidium sp. 394]
NYPGGAFIQYVVERIKEEDLYASLSEEKIEYYRNLAQKLRDDKLNAGSAKTDFKRLVQGSAKDDIHKIGAQASLNHISDVTSIQFILLAVRGCSNHGLKPLYHASDRARTFFEGYLNISTSQFLTLMETAAIGGVSDHNQTEGRKAKAEVRQTLLRQLRDAATSTAEDGSAPTITDPNSIPFVEWKNYHKIVRTYKVEVFGWPMVDTGRMTDPNSMGAGTVNRQLHLINTGKCGFRRLTDEEWDKWRSTFNSEVESGDVNVGTCKTRKDAGQKRKRDDEVINSPAATGQATATMPTQDGPSIPTHNIGAVPQPIIQHPPPAPLAPPHFLQPTFGLEPNTTSLASPVFPLQSPYTFSFNALSPSSSIDHTSAPLFPAHPASPGPSNYSRPLRFQNQTPETYTSNSPSRSRSRTPSNTRRTTRRGATPRGTEFASPSA